MIQNQDIICFANDWDSDPLSKKHIMLRLARHNRVLWVNSIGNRNPTASPRDLKRVMTKLWAFTRGVRQVADNIYVYSPLAIPFHGNRTARQINSEWLRQSLRGVCHKLGFADPITWTFLPTSADVVGHLGERFIVYQCVDEYSEFTGTDGTAILEMERQLITKANAVIVSSAPLHRRKIRHNRHTYLVTHGVDVEHFRKACSSQTTVPADLAALPGPRIGFYGLIADWVDLKLIRYLALSKPHWSLVLIGKVEADTSDLEGLSNVHLLGRKNYRDLPAYCKGFDVAILPFEVNALTHSANPLKLREYLAAGLPVVATAIPEVERLERLVRIGRSHANFLAHIEKLVAEGLTGPRLAVSRTMDGESWEQKVEEMSEIIAGSRSAVAIPALAS